MANSYVTLYRKQKNIIRGKLTTAVAVSPDTELKMRQMVEKKTKGTVEFETEVNPDNIGMIMNKPDVDGVLIGRASLDVDNFLRMVNYLKKDQEK